jgi:hypothetical protein
MRLNKEDCESLRRRIKGIADDMNDARRNGGSPPLGGEAVANVMLAYRHLEDASMRLGKALQAIDGGISVYDRGQVPGTFSRE